MNTGSRKTTQIKKRGGGGKERDHVSTHKAEEEKAQGRRGTRIMKTQHKKLGEGQQKALRASSS